MTQHKCVQLDHVLQMYHLRCHRGYRPSFIRTPPVESATSITVQLSSLLVAAAVHFIQQSPMASTCLSCLVLPSSFVIGSATISSVAQCSSVTLSVVKASRTKW